MTVADRIRAARIKRGLTQAELAERLKLTPQAISEWEQGGNGPSKDRLVDVAKVLDLSLLELLR